MDSICGFGLFHHRVYNDAALALPSILAVAGDDVRGPSHLVPVPRASQILYAPPQIISPPSLEGSQHCTTMPYV